MKTTIKTSPRIGDLPRRRRKKEPSSETLLRVEWLQWLIDQYGAETVAEWQEPPVSFEEWRRKRSLEAHHAA